MEEDGRGPSDDSSRELQDEVTRVEGVRYLEGASGHAVFSTVSLVVASALLAFGRGGLALVAVIVAYGVAMNGLSIYAWDRMRSSLRSWFERSTEEPSRTLTGYRPSPEMKAELAAGFLMIGSLILLLVAGMTTVRTVGVASGVQLSIGGLLVANVGALALAYRRSS